MIKNLIFDFGGVIAPISREQAVEAFRQLGVADADQRLDKYHQTGIFQELEEGKITPDEFQVKLGQLCGGRTPSWEETRQAWLGYFTGLDERLLDCLKELRKRYKLFVLSNTNPYVMDCGSMSVFGDDIPDQWAFSLAGLIRFCSRAKVLPLHFVTNVIFDRRQSVPSIRFVPSNQNGQLLFLDADSLAQVYRVATSQTVTDMLHVRLIPDPNAAVQQAAQPVAQPAPAVAPVQPVAPAASVAPAPQPVAPAMQQTMCAQPAPAVAAPSTNDLMAQAAQAAAQANAMLNQAAPVAPAQSFSQPAPAAPVQPVQQPAGPAVAPVQPVAPAAPVQPAPAAAPVQPAPTSDSAMMNNALADLLSAAGSYGPQA